MSDFDEYENNLYLQSRTQKVVEPAPPCEQRLQASPMKHCISKTHTMEQLLLCFSVIAIISLLYSVGAARRNHSGPYSPLGKGKSPTSKKTA